MTYAFSMDVPQPVEMYEQVHSELVQRLGRELPTGCLMHMATATDTGFRITEVWESHDVCDRFGDEVMRPLMAEMSGLAPQLIEQGPPPSNELPLLGFAADSGSHVSV